MGVIMNLNTYLSFLVLVVSFFVESLGSSCNLNNIIGKYSPDWDSLDARPLPLWYDDAKVGIFIHWGVFSVPSFATEWFWEDWRGQSEASFVRFMNQNYKPNFTYTEFAPQFTAELYDPQHWANVFKKSGAKYVVLTSKHHEGYTLWPSATSWNWNSVDVGPHKDLVGSLATAVRNTSLRFGVYHSLYEWFNPLYLADKSSSYQERQFVEKKVLPEMLELISKYKPEVLWSDGQWEAPSSYWCSREFLAWLYNSSPVKDTVVTNDRWGSDTLCKHGGYLTCQDRYSPGKLQPKKWENAMTLDKTSWGFNRLSKLSDYLSMEELLATLVSSVSCGGNILINVGPTADGRIVPIMEERLLQLGEWLQVNGDAIYKTEPWKFQNDTLTGDTWYTKSKSNSKIIFATFLTWPESNVLELSSIAEEKISAIFMLQKPNEIKLRWSNKTAPQKIQVYLPNKVKTQWAWSLRLELQ